MKEIVFFALTFLATPAMASNTVCSDASAQIQYKHTGWNAGIPPRDGDVIDTIELRVNGQVVSVSKAFQNRAPELGPINPDFSEIQVLKEESGSNGYNKDFSAKLVLSKNAANPKSVSTALPTEAYVICHEHFLAVP